MTLDMSTDYSAEQASFGLPKSMRRKKRLRPKTSMLDEDELVDWLVKETCVPGAPPQP